MSKATWSSRLLAIVACASSAGAGAGTLDLWGESLEYKIVLGYGVAMRVEDQDPALINGPVDPMQISFNPLTGGLGSFSHTGLPITANFDDNNRNFKRGSLLVNRGSAYSEMSWSGDMFGAVASGAYFYDLVFHDPNDNTSEETVNNDLEAARNESDSISNRTIPVNAFLEAATETSGEKARLLEAYAYGDFVLGESISANVRIGRHLAAWGESLFFPGVVAAQGPFDATKAFIPGAEIKEILLPTNQVSFNMSVGENLTLLGLYQFEFEPTEVFPLGDFFSPADLVGPASSFGYGSINPVHEEHCDEPTVTLLGTNLEAPPGSLCTAGEAFENEPEYILTLRTADNIPDDQKPWGAGIRYQFGPNLNLGAYHLRYVNHNPNVQLNMDYARVGDDAVTGTQITTQDFGVRVPVSYTIGYADEVEMTALSFSTVVWVFNIAGEVIQRDNVDTSLESTIAGVVAPWGTRGKTTQTQFSWLYVENPDFLIYDEVIFVGEAGWLHVDETEPVANQDGVCMSGTSDCSDFTEQGNELFYDRDAYAVQFLLSPKGRNVFTGWDLATPVNFAWLIDGTPSTPGVFGSLYGEGDMRASLGFTFQYLQNLELSATYNAFLGDPEKNIRNSLLRANPYADHDNVTFTVKYSL